MSMIPTRASVIFRVPIFKACYKCHVNIEFSLLNKFVLKQPVGKRPFPFGGRSAIVIRQDMSPHVHALLQKGVRVRRLLSIRVYWQTFQLSRDIKTVVQLKKLMQHWTEVALGSAWPSHGLTTSGINCQPMARLSNFSPGRRTVRHSSQVGKIKPTPLTSKGWISIKKY